MLKEIFGSLALLSQDVSGQPSRSRNHFPPLFNPFLIFRDETTVEK